MTLDFYPTPVRLASLLFLALAFLLTLSNVATFPYKVQWKQVCSTLIQWTASAKVSFVSALVTSIYSIIVAIYASSGFNVEDTYSDSLPDYSISVYALAVLTYISQWMYLVAVLFHCLSRIDKVFAKRTTRIATGITRILSVVIGIVAVTSQSLCYGEKTFKPNPNQMILKGYFYISFAVSGWVYLVVMATSIILTSEAIPLHSAAPEGYKLPLIVYMLSVTVLEGVICVLITFENDYAMELLIGASYILLRYFATRVMDCCERGQTERNQLKRALSGTSGEWNKDDEATPPLPPSEELSPK